LVQVTFCLVRSGQTLIGLWFRIFFSENAKKWKFSMNWFKKYPGGHRVRKIGVKMGKAHIYYR